MSEKTVLCACSGMNPRGAITRTSVYDLSIEREDIEYCCIVASGGNYQKFIDLAKDNTVIAVNGCENCCPETILKTKDRKLIDDIVVKEIPYYETTNLSGGNTVYIAGHIEFG